jgi:hypothetical protein
MNKKKLVEPLEQNINKVEIDSRYMFKKEDKVLLNEEIINTEEPKENANNLGSTYTIKKDEEDKLTTIEEPRQNFNDTLGSTYTIKKEGVIEEANNDESNINNQEDLENLIEDFRNDTFEKNITNSEKLDLDIAFKNKPDKFNDVS